MHDIRERENFIRHSNRNKKHQTVQKFTCVAGCQKGHNTNRAGHLLIESEENVIIYGA